MDPMIHRAAPCCRVCGDLICITSRFVWLVLRNWLTKKFKSDAGEAWGFKSSGMWPFVIGQLVSNFLEDYSASLGSCECSCRRLLDAKHKHTTALHTLGTTYPVTWPHIAVDINHQQHCCGHLRCHVWSLFVLK